MKTTQRQYEKISGIFPRQRGNVTIDNLTMLNAMLHVLEHGCKWRGLPSSFGNWRSICTRMSRCSKNGVLDRIFARLQQEQMIRINADAFSLGSTVIKVHPDGTGALKKMALSQPADPAEDGHKTASDRRIFTGLTNWTARSSGLSFLP